MSAGIEKLEGVEAVQVSLEEGEAEVTLEPGNAFDPEQIRDVARDNGFTPMSAEVRVRGKLVIEGEALALAVTGLDREYRLLEHPASAGRLAALARAGAGARVVIAGSLPESDRATSEASALALLDFELEEH